MGKIHIKLGELLKSKGLSRNKFAQRAELQRTQLNKYINNEIALLSVDVLYWIVKFQIYLNTKRIDGSPLGLPVFSSIKCNPISKMSILSNTKIPILK